MNGPQPEDSRPLWHDGRSRIPDKLLAKARELRLQQTDAETLLWACLRDRQLMGAKFRRQHVVGNWIADLYCHEARLVIELDGHVHQMQVPADAVRQRALEGLGYRVLRFSNERVSQHTGEVLEEIAAAVASLRGRVGKET